MFVRKIWGFFSKKSEPEIETKSVVTSIFDEARFLRNLHTAMSHAIYTCVLRTSNRIEDYEIVGNWSNFQRYRYTPEGSYRKFSLRSFSLKDVAANSIFIPEHGLVPQIKQWYYHVDDISKVNTFHIVLGNVFSAPKNSPFSDDTFGLNSSLQNVLSIALFARDVRYGNCCYRCQVIAKYLWEHPYGIHRIETITMATFDHVFIVVNRAKDSDIKNPDTWGKAWVIDAWYQELKDDKIKEGIIFKACELKDKLKIIKAFAQDQIKRMKDLGLPYNTTIYPELKNDIGEVFNEIDLTRDRYPSYDFPNFKLENYHIIINNTGKDWSNIYSVFFPEHKKKFKKFLDQIKSLNEVNRVGFFNARKKILEAKGYLSAERKSVSPPTPTQNEDMELLKVLISQKLDPSLGMKAQMKAIDAEFDRKFLENTMLLDMCNRADANNTIFLLAAAKEQNSSVFDRLIRDGADINLALDIAWALTNPKLVKFLSAKKADQDAEMKKNCVGFFSSYQQSEKINSELTGRKFCIQTAICPR